MPTRISIKYCCSQGIIKGILSSTNDVGAYRVFCFHIAVTCVTSVACTYSTILDVIKLIL